MPIKKKTAFTIDFIVVIVIYVFIRNLLPQLGSVAIFIALGAGIVAYLIGKLIGLPTEKEKELIEREETKHEMEKERHKTSRANVSRLGMTKEEMEKEKIVEEMMKKDDE